MSLIRVRDKSGKYIDIPALQGESAYDIAVRNGFVGTEQEWLESMGFANYVVLNKLGDSNGNLTYDGKAVGGLVLHSKYYSNDLTNGVVGAGIGSYDAFLEVFEPLPDNAIIYDIGIWYEKTDGVAKEYKDIELYTSELISSNGSFEIFANPIFDSGLLQGYGVGRINDTGAGILLNSIKSIDGKTKGFTVYYYEA